MPKLTKSEFASLVQSMPGASDDDILAAAAEREKGLVEKVWDKANAPLTNLPSKIGKFVGNAIDQRSLSESPMQARMKGFLAGASEGAGNVLDSLTSPLNIALTLTGYGAAKAGAKGLLGISKAARGAEAALQAPMVAEGAKNTYEGVKEGNYGKAGAGVLETAGGVAGVGTAFKHAFPVQKVAEAYAREAGIPVERMAPHTPVKVQPETAKQIADSYEAMPHSPEDPAVKNSYNALSKETSKQFKFVRDRAGVKMETWTGKGQPYANSAEMIADVEKNNHLWFFPTEEGFGSAAAEAGNPLLVKGDSGLPVNDEFRAIHDYFGHAKEGHQFGPSGEENAWVAHSKMFSDDARPAMTTETRGQNSWVNSGPHLRNDAGVIPKKGEAGYVPPQARPFAPQKTGLLPAEFHQRGDVPLFAQEAPVDVLPPRVPGEGDAVYAEIRDSKPTPGPSLGGGQEALLPAGSALESDPRTAALGGGERTQVSSPSQPAYDLGRAASIVDELTTKNGGASFNLFKGDLNGTPHYAVSVFPERGEVVPGKASAEQVAGFIQKNADLLQDPKNSIGTWFNQADGKTYLDVSATTPDIKEAVALGKAKNQLAIYDLGKGQEISLSQPKPQGANADLPLVRQMEGAGPEFQQLEDGAVAQPQRGVQPLVAPEGADVPSIPKPNQVAEQKAKLDAFRKQAAVDRGEKPLPRGAANPVDRIAALPDGDKPGYAQVPFAVADQATQDRLVREVDYSKPSLQRVPLDQLVATQPTITRDVAVGKLSEAPGALTEVPREAIGAPRSDAPVVYQGADGKLYLGGGTHRAVAAWAKGEKDIQAIVYPAKEGAVAPEALKRQALNGGFSAAAIAAPAAAQLIPDDPDSNLDDYGRVGLNILGAAGLVGAAVRGRQVKALSPIQDAASKGAAALWLGGKKAWAQAVGKNASPELYAASQKLVDRHLQTTANQLPNTKKLLALNKQGMADHQWYDKTEQELKGMFGKDANLMAKFFAATSNNATVASNASLALKALRQFKSGEPFTGFLPDVIENLNRAAKNKPLNGRKIDNFAKALSGDQDAVVADRWIMRAFGFEKGSAPTDTQYDFMENAIKRIAEQTKQTPRQVQAAIWFAYKNAAEKGKNRPLSPAPENALRHSINLRHGEALTENKRFDKGRAQARNPKLPFASGE